MSLVAEFRSQLSEYLSKSRSPCENLVIFENNSNCDFSFVSKYSIWSNYLQSAETQVDFSHSDDILILRSGKESREEACKALIRESEKWKLRIDRLESDDKRYLISLHRSSTFRIALEAVGAVNFSGDVQKDELETISIERSNDGEESISNFRVKTIEGVLKNIVACASKYVYVTDSSIAKHKLLLATSSNFKRSDESDDRVRVNCGVVLCDNKKSHQTADEYLTKRRNDMHLIAIHKYGVRVKDDKNFLKMIEKLGQSAAILDMVEVKCSNVLKLTSSPKQPFILYNSARLETLLENFDRKVAEGYYEEARPLSETDMSLLSEDLEWELLKLILAYPEVMQKASCDIEKGKCGLHLLYKYLYTFVTTFSMYYSKIRVLTENRPQLMPVLHAKVLLLRVVQKYLNQTLKIFNIDPVLFM